MTLLNATAFAIGWIFGSLIIPCILGGIGAIIAPKKSKLKVFLIISIIVWVVIALLSLN